MKDKSKLMMVMFLAVGLTLMMSTGVATGGHSEDQIITGYGIVNNVDELNNSMVVIFTNSNVENVTLIFGDINLPMQINNESVVGENVQWNCLANLTNDEISVLVMPQNITYNLSTSIEIATDVDVEVDNNNNNTNNNTNENSNENENDNSNNNTVIVNLFDRAGEYISENQWIIWGVAIAFGGVIVVVAIVQVAKDAGDRYRRIF